VQKLVDGIGSPAFYTCLEKLAEGDQRQDRACTLKVQVVGKLMHHRDIPVSETECDLIQCIGAVYERGTGSESDQGIHIRGSVNQCLKPDTIVFEVDKYDRNQEQKLGKGEDHGIFRAKEDARQRP